MNRLMAIFRLMCPKWGRSRAPNMVAKKKLEIDAFDVSVEFIQETLDAMSEGVSVTRMIDGELYMVVCNNEFFKILDFPPAYQNMPMPFADLLRFNAERGEYGEGDVEEQVYSRVELAKSFEPHSFQRTRPDGTVIKIVGKPLRSGDGFVSTYTDVTDRYVAETYSDLMIQAFDRSGAGVAVFDPSDQLVFVNDTLRRNNPFIDDESLNKLTYIGWGEKLLEHNVIVDAKGREASWLDTWINMRHDTSGGNEVHRTDNSWRYVDAVKLDNDYTVLVSTNITDLKRIEEEVVRAKEDAEFANRAKTDFLANMSHELRTPLNSIIGFSELLISMSIDTISPEKVIEYLRDINGSGRHLLRLISDVLDISKIEVGEMKLYESSLCLRELTEQSLRMIRERAQRHGAKIDYDENMPKVRLRADETRIKQILLNLLTNSIKFTDRGGSISVGWTLNEGGSLTLQVSDSGTGMDEKSIKIALEPFGQVAQTLTREHEGTGLGVPLSRRLAELHQAELVIESELGVGTKVSITFPPERVITDFE